MLVKFYIERVVMCRCVNKNNKKAAVRLLTLVLMLVVVRLYIRECIIPFDIVYAEELVKEDIQQEETNGWTWWQKALVISGMVVIAYLLWKNMQVTGEVIRLNSQMRDVIDITKLNNGEIERISNQVTNIVDVTTVNGGEIQNIKGQIDNLNYIMDATEEKVRVAFLKVQQRFSVLNEAVTDLENKIDNGSGEVSASSEDI